MSHSCSGKEVDGVHTQSPSRPDRSVVEAIRSQILRTPERIAVRFGENSISYAELGTRSHSLATRLRDLGVRPDVLVTVLAQRSIGLVTGLLATLEAGGAYVPVDPGYPPERVRYMIGDAASSVVLAGPGLLGTVSEGVHVIPLDDAPLDTSADATPFPVGLNSLAYVIYTSGSTGRPKGVMNTHSGLSNRLTWMQDQFQLSESDRVLQKTPYSFDVSVWEFFWPLMVGARLVVAEPEGHLDPSYLADLIERDGITVLHFVPSMLELFLQADRLVERCASLRLVVCSGEELPRTLVNKFFERLGPTGAELYNLYGPTEAAIDVTYWRCRPDRDGPVPIGHPVANTQIHILDPDMRPVPVGEEGELVIGGVQVARGYLNQAALTAERFVPDLLAASPEARLYRTGDRAKQRSDGAKQYQL